MFKLGTRRLAVAAVLLFLFATSSAQGQPRSIMQRGVHHTAGSTGTDGPRIGAKSEAHSWGWTGGAERKSHPRRYCWATAPVESQRDSLPAGEGEAFRLSASLTGLADVAHLYISANSTAKTVVMGIYSNSGGRPAAPSAGSAPSSSPGAWASVAITPIQLVAGRTYWLAILGEGGTLRYRDRQGGPCPSETSGQTSLGALPAFWRTGTFYSDCPASAYVAAGDPPAAPAPTEPVAPAPPLPTPPVAVTPVEEPVPLKPVNTAGRLSRGARSKARNSPPRAGVWSGSPTFYAYQWQDCNPSGQHCSSIGGAAASTHKLAASDVGHTLRVVVTASNAGGATAATSAASPVVGVASSPGLLVGNSAIQSSSDESVAGSAEAFQYTASASGTVHSLSLYVGAGNTVPAVVVGLYSSAGGNPATLATSAVIVSPAAGAWNTVEVAPVAMHSGSVYWLAALAPAGTLVMRDIASGGGPTETSASASLSALPSGWSSGSSWANSPASFYASTSTVEAPAVTPVNTALPTISGTPVEGQTLSASPGSWSGSATSLAYQWQDCDTSGEACASISGASASSYKLASTDAGHTIRVVVTATGTGGSAKPSLRPR